MLQACCSRALAKCSRKRSHPVRVCHKEAAGQRYLMETSVPSTFCMWWGLPRASSSPPGCWCWVSSSSSCPCQCLASNRVAPPSGSPRLQTSPVPVRRASRCLQGAARVQGIPLGARLGFLSLVLVAKQAASEPKP